MAVCRKLTLGGSTYGRKMEPNFKKQKLCLKAKKPTAKPFNILPEQSGRNDVSSAKIVEANVIDLTENDDGCDHVVDNR